MYSLLLLLVVVVVVAWVFYDVYSSGASPGEGIDGRLDSLEGSILVGERNLPHVAEGIRDQVSRHISQARGHLDWARRRASEGNYEMAEADVASGVSELSKATLMIDSH